MATTFRPAPGLFLIVTTSLTGLVSCSPRPSDPLPAHWSSSDSAVELTPVRLDLGKVHPGREAAGKVLICNRGTATLLIARFETSCPCVRAMMERSVLEPGQTSAINIAFDSGAEPDFRGSLSVEYTVKAPTGDALVTGYIDVSVGGVTASSVAERIEGAQPEEPRR